MKNWIIKAINKTRSRMYKNLTIKQLKMIDDKAYDSTQDINRNKLTIAKYFF